MCNRCFGNLTLCVPTAILRGDLLSASWFLDENYSSLEDCITSRILKVEWRQAVKLS